MSNFGTYSDQPHSSYHSGGPPTGGGREHDFNRLATVVANNVAKIAKNHNDMQRMIGQIGTPQDNSDLREKLHNIQHYTNRVAQETNGYMKQLHNCPNLGSQSEQRQRKIQKDRLVNDFSTALKNFQSAQRSSAEKERESVARARAHSGSNYDPFVDERKSDDQLVGLDRYSASDPFGGTNDVGFSHPTQQTVQMEQDVDLSLIQEREQAIQKLEGDIVDVNQIFKDLGMLVHEQGEVVDSIEANVENAAIHVEQGTDQLAKAREYQSKARRKKCIIILVVVLILAIIATIIGVTVGRN